MPATAVLIPTTRPRASASAPPELPGFSAASVWMTSSTTRIVAPARVGQRPAERRDDAGGDGAAEPVRVPDRDHELPDPQAACVAELGRGQLAVVRAQHREVGQRIAAADLRAEHATVVERRAHAVAAGDDVRGGEQEAVRRDRDGRAAAARASAAEHLDRGDRRRDALGSLDHRPRIGVERLFVVEPLADERDSGHAARVAPGICPAGRQPEEFLYVAGLASRGAKDELRGDHEDDTCRFVCGAGCRVARGRPVGGVPEGQASREAGARRKRCSRR